MTQTKHSILKTPFIALLFLSIIALTGCFGDSQPSENDIKSMSTEFFDKELSTQPKIAGVGEIGIDYFRCDPEEKHPENAKMTNRQVQQKAFYP